MFNRRVHRDQSWGCKGITFAVSLRSLRFIFFLLFLSGTSYGQSQYDINDPRNPDCPCHKLQKLADEEFALLDKKQNNESGSPDQVEAKKQDNVRADRQRSEIRNSRSGIVSRVKVKGVKIRKGRHYFRKRYAGIKRVRTDYSVCVRW